MKSPLVRLHGEAEAGLVGRRVRRDVRRPRAVALLEPERVDRAVAARHQAVRLRRRPQRVPQARRRTRSGSRAPSRARRRTSRARRGTARRRPRARAPTCTGSRRARATSSSAAAGSSRAFGPHSPKQARLAVTSLTWTDPSRGAWRSIQRRSWVPKAVPVTSRKRSSPVRITDRSHSIPPRGFSICVYVTRPTGRSTSFAHSRCRSVERAGAEHLELREARLVEQARPPRAWRRPRPRSPATSSRPPSRAAAAPRRRRRRSTRTS